MALVLMLAWCGDEDLPELSPPTVVLDPEPVLLPAPLARDPEPLDAAVEAAVVTSAPLDAGRVAPPRREPDVEDYMRRHAAELSAAGFAAGAV